MHFDIFGTTTFGKKIYIYIRNTLTRVYVSCKTETSHLVIRAKIYSERSEFQFSGP